MTNSRAIDARILKTLILAAFFLSGVSALIYQVVWMRMLTLTFGTTVFAVTTVVTVFMAGLAIGSFYFGRWVDQRAEKDGLLKLYALLEGGIGLYCLFTPWAFSHLELLYGYIYTLADINFYLFSFIRFFFSLLILITPTVLMGATLPVLSKYIVTHKETVGKNVGMLYGLNTFGAVFGVLLTAFVLIPSWGVKESLFTAVFLNILIAAGIYYAARRTGDKPGSAPAPAISRKERRRKQKLEGKPLPNYIYRLILLAFAASGFAALAYEVAWFRILSMTIGNSVYAFSMMLATFLLGLALGSYVFAFFIDRVQERLRAFAIMEILIGISVIGLTPLFGKLPLAFMGILQHFTFDFWAFQVVNFLTAFIAIIIPTLLMGAIFPLVVRVITDDPGRLGRNVGSLYALNTIGGVLGSFLAGFFFIPFLGVQNTLFLMAALSLCVGVLLLFYSQASALLKRGGAVISVIVLLSALLFPSWDRVLLTSGVYLYAGNVMGFFKRGDFMKGLKEVNDVIYYDEGITGTTAVVKRFENLVLSVNGKGIADIKRDPVTFKVLGALPLMLHRAPQNALLIGVGSGITLGAMERFPLKEIEAVEISPEVVEASRLFSAYNYNALEDKRLKLIVDDGRTHLTYSDKLYDVIVSQPSVPWMPGASNLYTREFYEEAKRSLKPGGILTQWIQAYRMESEDVKTLMRSFQEVFPHTTMWTYKVGSILLLGSREPLSVPYDKVIKSFADPRISGMMKSIGIVSPEMLLGGFTLDEESLQDFVGDGILNTDNRPVIEFSGPKSLYKYTGVKNYNEMAEYAPFVRPEVSGMVQELDGGQRIPAFKVESFLGDRWAMTYAGVSVKNSIIGEVKAPEIPRVAKGIMTLVEWKRSGSPAGISGVETGKPVKGESRIRGEGSLRLRAVATGTEALDGPALAALVSRSVRGREAGRGETSIEGRPFLWAMDERGHERILHFSWHCSGNAMRYIGTFIPAPSGDELLNEVIGEISGGFKCAHGSGT